jgi:prophage antirepressor-like protein
MANARDAISRLKDSQKITVQSMDSVGRPHKAWYISYQGMYKLAWTSYKPEAEAFTDWAALDPIILGELHENEMRKDFTVSERVAIGKELEAYLGNRQGQRTDRELRVNLPEVEHG